jgi:hypothetical protein
MNIKIVVTQEEHYQFANEICETIETSAKLRGTGIAKRTPDYIQKKMENQDAIIAFVILKVGSMENLWRTPD